MDRARRAIPVGNKQCHARHVKKCQENHRRKLAEMKCQIDNKPPKRHPHLRKNLKKEQLMEERFAEIERDNRLLLEKMSYIMRRALSLRPTPESENPGRTLLASAPAHAHARLVPVAGCRAASRGASLLGVTGRVSH